MWVVCGDGGGDEEEGCGWKKGEEVKTLRRNRQTGGKPDSMVSNSPGERVFKESVQLCLKNKTKQPLEIKKNDTENFPLSLLTWRSSMAFSRQVLVL